MALCLRLGKTLGELDAMPAEELFLWRAYDRISPIGDIRGDVQAAMTAAAVFQAAGAKVSAADLLPQWGKPVEEEPEEDTAESFFAWLKGRAVVTAAEESAS